MIRQLGFLAAGALLSSAAFSFHQQGVANCDGCHVMHDEPGSVSPTVGLRGQSVLLQGESPSDVCLSCHAEQHGSVLGANPLAPPPEKGAGNFVFLLEANLNDAADSATNPITGGAAGHNLVAPGHGLAADSRHSKSPGGSFPAGDLGCTSCHDPHGNQNFRMLYGVGQVQGGLFTFQYPAPLAEGIDLEAGFESPSLHTAYKSGMTDWCGNCHGRYHDQFELSAVPPAVLFEHHVGVPVETEVSDRYNEYLGDDNPVGGDAATAYLPQVPFESPTAAVTSTQGTNPSSQVMCLSCHRAHATSSPFAGRWDLRVALLSEDGVRSGSYPIPNPYLGQVQGPLCAKCHAPEQVVQGPESILSLQR